MAQLIFFMETLTLLFQLLQKLKIDLKLELYILQFTMNYSLQKEEKEPFLMIEGLE